MLILYSILSMLDFENMAQNLIFLLSQCPATTQQKNEFFLLKLMINIGYNDLNISMFPYIWIYTSHKRVRKCTIKKIAFLIQKTKMVIFCQTPTNAAVYSFKTMDKYFNILLLPK